jgi:hypothetical protein
VADTPDTSANNTDITVGFNYGEITSTGDDGSNVISKSGANGPTSLSLSVSSEYTDVKWYVDDVLIQIPENETGITLDATSATYTAQRHSITFTGRVDGHWYSSQPIPFTVLN